MAAHKYQLVDIHEVPDNTAMYLQIERDSPLSLTRQIYDQLRQRILSGELHANERLPSTRELARMLGVSRNVILQAYGQLWAEGYIESRQGSGYYVLKAFYPPRKDQRTAPTTPASVLDALQRPATDGRLVPDLVDFRSGIPALDQFPRRAWCRAAHHIWMQVDPLLFGYGHPEGRLELRSALVHYLQKVRGVRCEAEQIIITSGATQAFTLIAKVLLHPGDHVLIEDPVTIEIQAILASTGATLDPVTVDEAGMQVDCIPQDRSCRLIFVTPSHQFPMGGVLPIQRRIGLLQLAYEHDAYIVEDDYDSEFRYDGPPLSSLQGLAPERVIYIGTFSKILSPALRLGYLIVPTSLSEAFRTQKWLADLHTPSLTQLALAEFISQGHLEHHITRMRQVYRRRRARILSALRHYFGDDVVIHGASTGLHLVAQFPHMQFSPHIVEQAVRAGVRVYPVEHHAIQPGRHLHDIILGYGNVPEERIEVGVQRLHRALTAISEGERTT